LTLKIVVTSTTSTTPTPASPTSAQRAISCILSSRRIQTCVPTTGRCLHCSPVFPFVLLPLRLPRWVGGLEYIRQLRIWLV
jgi:hypothetical protein